MGLKQMIRIWKMETSSMVIRTEESHMKNLMKTFHSAI